MRVRQALEFFERAWANLANREGAPDLTPLKANPYEAFPAAAEAGLQVRVPRLEPGNEKSIVSTGTPGPLSRFPGYESPGYFLPIPWDEGD